MTTPTDTPAIDRPGRHRLTACSGADAVARVERLVCGPGAVTSAAAAEGAVAAGGRAAVLLDTGPRPSAAAAPTGAWVQHRLRHAGAAPTAGFAFELLAGDAQEAVDHCLIGHHLAQALSAPGVCALEPQVADALAVVCIPGQLVAPLAPANDDGGDGILAVARDAFVAVSKQTGRQRRPVTRRGPDGAPRAIVTAGAAGATAVEAAALLTAAGVDCAAVCVALLTPNPAGDLRAALEGVESVVVIDPVGASAGQVALAGLVRAAGPADRPVQQLLRAPGSPQDLLPGVAAAFGLATPPEIPPVAATTATALALGALPAGPWGEDLLLSTAGVLAQVADVGRIRRRPTAGVTALHLEPAPGAADPGGLDVLVAAHHGLIDADAVMQLRPGGALLLLSPGPGQSAPRLPGTIADAVAERAAQVCWLPAQAQAPTSLEARNDYLTGAVLAALATSAPPDLDDLLQRLAAAGTTTVPLQAGVAAVRPVDEPAAAAPVSPATTPRMPDEPDDEPAADWIEAVRHFHVAGKGAVSADEPIGGLPLRPWALSRLVSPERLRSAYPLVLGAGGVQPFVELADQILASGYELLPRNVGRLAASVARVAGTGDPQPLARAFADARAEITARFDLSDAGRRTLDEELDHFAEALGEQQVLGLGPQTLMEMLARAAAEARQARLAAFHDDVAALAQRLEARLQTDSGARSADRLGASLGGAFQVDHEVLAKALPARAGTKPLDAERRRRIETSLAQLRDFLEHGEARLPDAVVLHPGLLTSTSLPAGVRAVPHGAGMDAAAGYFEASARQLVDLLRAVRTARLEVDAQFRPEHEAALARLDWQGLRRDELALVPPVFILDTTRRVLGGALSALSALLRSGRPLHLILLDGAPGMDRDVDAEALAATHVDLGPIAVAHRDASVLQSTLSQPTHLYAGLGRLAASPRPSVAVIASPDWSSMTPPWVQLAAAHESRCTPCFAYEPDHTGAGTGRVDLQPNPAVGDDWVRVPVTAQAEVAAEEPFTFAHAAALSPRCRHAFRVIPVAAWSAEQIAIADYLRLEPDERVRRVPFLWVQTHEGLLARAVMTRAMAHACADRLRAWRSLTALAGPATSTQVPAGAAATAASIAPAAAAAAAAAAADPGDLERVRAEAASAAIGRLAQALLASDGAGLASAAGRLGSAPPPAAVPAETEAAAGAAPPEPASSSPGDLGEPFIDSPLCTSCHDCVNLNPRMFQYDANKQAFLADPAAGTYAELVKAAEGCPSRCIYPGAPRPGDATATDKLIERARKFA